MKREVDAPTPKARMEDHKMIDPKRVRQIEQDLAAAQARVKSLEAERTLLEEAYDRICKESGVFPATRNTSESPFPQRNADQY